MIYFLVLWIDYELPGGWLASKMVPEHLKPFLGQPRVEHEIFSKKEEAVKKIRSLPPSACPRLFWCENLKRWEKDINYETVVNIEGESK